MYETHESFLLRVLKKYDRSDFICYKYYVDKYRDGYVIILSDPVIPDDTKIINTNLFENPESLENLIRTFSLSFQERIEMTIKTKVILDE